MFQTTNQTNVVNCNYIKRKNWWISLFEWFHPENEPNLEWWRSHHFFRSPMFCPIPKLNRRLQASARVEKVLLSNVPWAMKAVVLQQGHHCGLLCSWSLDVFSKPRVTQYLRCLTIVNMVTTLYDVDLTDMCIINIYTVATLYYITKSEKTWGPCNKTILADWRGLQKV